MKPLALAGLVHSLFCDFDTALGEAGLFKTSKTDNSGGDEETGLFKMDNMGDAYLCCGWLPETPCKSLSLCVCVCVCVLVWMYVVCMCMCLMHMHV